MVASSEMLKSALALAGAGFQIFPCVYGTKVPPHNSRGFYEATGNAAVIQRWFGGSFKRNLAIRTGAASKCFVVDEDVPGAIEHMETKYGVLPVTRMARSARGYHRYFLHPGVPITNSKSKVAPGIDIKGDAGYVLAPPSLHPEGVFYEWTNNAPIVEAPAWLVELAIRRPVPPSANRLWRTSGVLSVLAGHLHTVGPRCSGKSSCWHRWARGAGTLNSTGPRLRCTSS
jgi:hypothetical protein